MTLRSFFLSFGSALMLSLLGVSPSLAQAQSSPPGSLLSSAGGRYVFGQISSMRRDQFLLDTLTGRLWQKVCMVPEKDNAASCSVDAMEPVGFLDNDGKFIPGGAPPAK